MSHLSGRQGTRTKQTDPEGKTGTLDIKETDRNSEQEPPDPESQRNRDLDMRTNPLDLNRDQAPPKIWKTGRAAEGWETWTAWSG